MVSCPTLVILVLRCTPATLTGCGNKSSSVLSSRVATAPRSFVGPSRSSGVVPGAYVRTVVIFLFVRWQVELLLSHRSRGTGCHWIGNTRKITPKACLRGRPCRGHGSTMSTRSHRIRPRRRLIRTRATRCGATDSGTDRLERGCEQRQVRWRHAALGHEPCMEPYHAGDAVVSCHDRFKAGLPPCRFPSPSR